MTSYSLLVFVHVLAATGLFVAMAIEGVSLGWLSRSKTPEEVRQSLRSLALAGRLAPITMLTVVASGIWMAVAASVHGAWIATALGAVIAMGAVGGIVTNRRVRRLHAELAAGGARDHGAPRIPLRALDASLRIRVALGVGVLALMTLTPGLAGSLAIVVAAAVGGLLAAGIPSSRRRSAIGGVTQA